MSENIHADYAAYGNHITMPRFGIFGAVLPDGRVTLWVTRTAYYGEIRGEAHYPAPHPQLGRIDPPQYRYEAEIHSKDFVQVVADTWNEAWSTLFAQWSADDETSHPELPSQPALNQPPPRQLEG